MRTAAALLLSLFFSIYVLVTALAKVGDSPSGRVLPRKILVDSDEGNPRHINFFKQGNNVAGSPSVRASNHSLRDAYIALQTWKASITYDPKNITATWTGPDVCKYQGVFCTELPGGSRETVVSGIDLNHANLGGTLPEALGLLKYLALFHINTNRFTGTIPLSITKWEVLYELDLSNNLFSGAFPHVTLELPCLVYLDIRYNMFEGPLPAELFDKKLDAIFVNSNRFSQNIPENLGNSPASVIVFASNHFVGEIPSSLVQMAETLNEIIFLGNSLTGCIPLQFGALVDLTVLDLSFNNLSGILPPTISAMVNLEQLDVARNQLTGIIPETICLLPNLKNFTASFNFFTGEFAKCLLLPSQGVIFNDTENCIPGRPFERSPKECIAFSAIEQICPIPKLSPLIPQFSPPQIHLPCITPGSPLSSLIPSHSLPPCIDKSPLDLLPPPVSYPRYPYPSPRPPNIYWSSAPPYELRTPPYSFPSPPPPNFYWSPPPPYYMQSSPPYKYKSRPPAWLHRQEPFPSYVYGSSPPPSFSHKEESSPPPCS